MLEERSVYRHHVFEVACTGQSFTIRILPLSLDNPGQSMTLFQRSNGRASSTICWRISSTQRGHIGGSGQPRRFRFLVGLQGGLWLLGVNDGFWWMLCPSKTVSAARAAS